MEQLDPEDGLAVWDFSEGPDAVGGSFASLSRAWTSGCAARPCSSGIPASGARARDLFASDRDLAAIADPVVTMAAPSPGKSQGSHRGREVERKEVNTTGTTAGTASAAGTAAATTVTGVTTAAATAPGDVLQNPSAASRPSTCGRR